MVDLRNYDTSWVTILNTDFEKLMENAKNYAKDNGYTLSEAGELKKWSFRKFKYIKYFKMTMWKIIDYTIK